MEWTRNLIELDNELLLKKAPLDISRDYSATPKALAATLYDFFLSSFPHILTPNLWRPGVRFWSYITFCTCTSDRKWLQNVILCTKSMQIEFFSHSSYKYAYFYSQWLKWICFSIIVLQKVSAKKQWGCFILFLLFILYLSLYTASNSPWTSHKKWHKIWTQISCQITTHSNKYGSSIDDPEELMKQRVEWL